jgi:hypothetical protein
LNNILDKYTVQIKKDNQKKLKLTDRIEVKKQIKQKLLREVEGFRNSGKEFTLVNKIDKGELKSLVKQIKNRLGF